MSSFNMPRRPRLLYLVGKLVAFSHPHCCSCTAHELLRHDHQRVLQNEDNGNSTTSGASSSGLPGAEPSTSSREVPVAQFAVLGAAGDTQVAANTPTPRPPERRQRNKAAGAGASSVVARSSTPTSATTTEGILGAETRPHPVEKLQTSNKTAAVASGVGYGTNDGEDEMSRADFVSGSPAFLSHEAGSEMTSSCPNLTPVDHQDECSIFLQRAHLRTKLTSTPFDLRSGKGCFAAGYGAEAVVTAECTNTVRDSNCGTNCQSVCDDNPVCAWKNALFPATQYLLAGGFSVPGWGCFGAGYGWPPEVNVQCTNTLNPSNCGSFGACQAACDANEGPYPLHGCAWREGPAFPWSSNM